jgi:pimeloyl-ACP methyl ester carboxylesterase
MSLAGTIGMVGGIAATGGAIFASSVLARDLVQAAREFNHLVIDPVYFGADVPRGDGRPVIPVQGFLLDEWYLAPMRNWLDRMGYRSFASDIGRNTGRVKKLVARIIPRIEQVGKETGGPVTLIGHSLGGVIACRAAQVVPDAIGQIITMGSPLQSSGMMDSSIPLVALYSREDRIVRYPRALAPDGRPSIEIGGSHGGMAFNASIYRQLGSLLLEDRKVGDGRLRAAAQP